MDLWPKPTSGAKMKSRSSDRESFGIIITFSNLAILGQFWTNLKITPVGHLRVKTIDYYIKFPFILSMLLPADTLAKMFHFWVFIFIVLYNIAVNSSRKHCRGFNPWG